VLVIFSGVNTDVTRAQGEAYLLVSLSCFMVIAEPTHDVDLYGVGDKDQVGVEA
jgi:hypothetical protein